MARHTPPAEVAVAFIDALAGFARSVDSVKLISVLGDDGQAMIMYDMETPLGTLRAADSLTGYAA